MADDTLQQAIGLIKAGKDSEARGLLYHLVKTDPHNEMAWLWLSETMNEQQRLTTLEQAQKFNPESEKLSHALNRLRAKQKQAAPKPSAPPAEGPRPAPPIPTPPVDRSTMQTAQLTFLPEDDEAPPPPPRKETPPPAVADRSQIQTAPLPPLPTQIDRSVLKSARYDISPDTLSPDKLPPGLQLPAKPASPPVPNRADQNNVKTSQLANGPDEPVGQPVVAPKPAAVPVTQSQPLKAPVQAPPPSDRIDRSLLKAARFEEAEPTKTGPLKVPPPADIAPAAAVVAAQVVTPPPSKPQPKAEENAPSAVKQQMDALLSEPHPSPDPVQKPKKGSTPPPPTFPPVMEEAAAPKRKPRRRLSGLEIALVVIVVILVLAVIGFLVWDFFVPRPATPTPAVVPPVVIVTSTLPATNTPVDTPTPIPPPTLRPTFTAQVSPTATLDPYMSSILFIDPVSCAARQISAAGGASQLLTDAVPESCISPELSLDGSQFAYLGQLQGIETTNSLFVVTVNGMLPQTVIDQSQMPIWEVDWAPDNIWLAYTSMTGTFEGKPIVGLSIIRKDGTNPVRLTDEQTPSIIPDNRTAVSWSPDGQWIAFYADNRPYIVKPNGTGLEQLSDDAGQSLMVWSPDSRQIAFYSSDLDNPGIIVIGIDGRRSFVQNDNLIVPVSGDSLIWSPEGDQFVAYDVSQKALVLVSRNGRVIEPLAVVNGVPARLAWSPDGTQLAFIEQPQQGSPSGVLKVVNIDGTDLTILATTVANAPLRWKLPTSFAGTITPTLPVIKVPTTTPSP